MDFNERLLALREQKQELMDEAQAFLDTAEQDGRELSDDESARFDALMDDDKGEVAKLDAQIVNVEKLQANKKRLARERAEQNRLQQPEDITGGKPKSEPVVRRRMATLRAFKGDDAEAKAYEAGMFLRALKGRATREPDQAAEEFLASKGQPFKMAQTTDSNTGGGYLVPDALSATIVDNREEYGIARRVCDVVPMGTDTLSVPKVTGGLTVYAPGEGNTITASDATYAQVKLSSVKRAVLNQVSAELSDDALVNMSDRAAMEMSRALALQEDNELINGDGTSTYFGVEGLLQKLDSTGTATAATGNDTWTELTLTDVFDCFGTLPSQYWTMTPQIICSAQFYNTVLQRLKATAADSAAELASGNANASFFGYPVYFTSQMPEQSTASTVSMLFGNFRQGVILGDRTGVRMGMSADYAFADDVLTLRATSRYDLVVHEGGSTTGGAGAYVGLSTAS